MGTDAQLEACDPYKPSNLGQLGLDARWQVCVFSGYDLGHPG